MATRNDNQDWLDALAGKQSVDANPHTVANALVLREAIRRHESDLLGETCDFDEELTRLNARLHRENLFSEAPPISAAPSKGWTTLIAAIMSAFTLGAITMRFAFMPSMEGVRSDGSFSYESGHKKVVQIVLVSVPDPAATLRTAVSEAAKSSLNFSVRLEQGGYDLVLEGLIPNSPDQAGIKQAVGIGQSAGGDVLLQIRAKLSK